MNGDALHLENHYKVIQSAEEALDFNFNESCDSEELNESSPGSDEVTLGVPFLHQFRTPIQCKNLIFIEGKVLTNAVSFRIDFCTCRNDIIFHINPRLDQKYIARNTLIEGHWDEEEGHGVTRSPIERGKLFQFQIFVLEKEYMVCVNGLHMFIYKHRLSPSLISRLEIFGDIELTNVGLLICNLYPSPQLEKFVRSENSLVLPVTRFLEKGFGYYGKILIQARVKLLPVSFYINIQNKNQIYPHPKIIYHLNVRYSSEGCIIQNSWGLRGECWDEEVRSPIPEALYPGSDFGLMIETNNVFIQTKGANWELPDFSHRLNPLTGMYVHIQGDIILKLLKIFPETDNSPAF